MSIVSLLQHSIRPKTVHNTRLTEYLYYLIPPHFGADLLHLIPFPNTKQINLTFHLGWNTNQLIKLTKYSIHYFIPKTKHIHVNYVTSNRNTNRLITEDKY